MRALFDTNTDDDEQKLDLGNKSKKNYSHAMRSLRFPILFATLSTNLVMLRITLVNVGT